MIVVIQCAGTKSPDAGVFEHQGMPVDFVARPELAQSSTGRRLAHPDNLVPGESRTWRDLILELNAKPNRPPGLMPAAELYKDQAFSRLRAALPLKQIFILSAGWGLVRGDFRLPVYNITYSNQVDAINRRRESDASFSDFNQLSDQAPGADEVVHFFGGTSYLPLFVRLTNELRCRKIIHFKSQKTTIPPGFEGRRYLGTGNTNWHYKALSDYLDGLQPASNRLNRLYADKN